MHSTICMTRRYKMSDSKPILTYFEGRGKGEFVRLMLAAAGIDWIDNFLKEPEQIEKLQNDGTLLFQQVPLLQWNGVNMVQSFAIVRYIARKYDLYGSKDEEFCVDTLCEGARDFYQPFMRIGFDDIEKVKTDIRSKFLPRYMPVYEKILSSSKSGFLVGNGLTMADVSLFEVLLLIFEILPDTFDDYPKCKEFNEKMKNLPNFSSFLNGPKRQRPNDEKIIAEVKKILKW